MYVYIKHDFLQQGSQIETSEKLYCNLKKQHTFTFEITVVNTAIVALAAIIAYNRVFTVLTDFC